MTGTAVSFGTLDWAVVGLYFIANTAKIQLYYWVPGAAGTSIGRTLVSATAPFTWAAGHFCRWSVTVPVVRV